MPEHSADRIGFRHLCLRGFAYMLLVAALMQAVLFEATYMPNVRFSEIGLTESLQSLLLLAGTILAIVAAAWTTACPTSPCWSSACSAPR